MTRSLAKVVVSIISNHVSGTANRRGFAVSAMEASRKNMMTQKTKEKEAAASWIPDPVTGYYRPENVSNEIDVAELREMFLKQSKSKNTKN